MKIKRRLRVLRNKQSMRMITYLSIILALIITGASGVMIFEYTNQNGSIKNFFDALWWSLVTITTVGYGDVVPVTFWGRIIGIFFILLGFIIFSTFTAYVASSFVDSKVKERKGLSRYKDKNHILICGWNRSGYKILDFIRKKTLDFNQDIVLVNELEENDISLLRNHYPKLNINFIHGDVTNQEVMLQANAADASHIILLFDESSQVTRASDERTIIAIHNLAFLKMKGKISIQLNDSKYLPHLRKQNIQNIIINDELGGSLLGYSATNPTVPDFLQTILKNPETSAFKDMPVPREFVNKTYGKFCEYLKNKSDLIVLGLVSVKPEVSIEEILSDDTSAIDKFIKRQFELSDKQYKPDSSVNIVKIKPPADYIIQDNDVAIVL